MISNDKDIKKHYPRGSVVKTVSENIKFGKVVGYEYEEGKLNLVVEYDDDEGAKLLVSPNTDVLRATESERKKRNADKRKISKSESSDGDETEIRVIDGDAIAKGEAAALTLEECSQVNKDPRNDYLDAVCCGMYGTHILGMDKAVGEDRSVTTSIVIAEGEIDTLQVWDAKTAIEKGEAIHKEIEQSLGSFVAQCYDGSVCVEDSKEACNICKLPDPVIEVVQLRDSTDEEIQKREDYFGSLLGTSDFADLEVRVLAQQAEENARVLPHNPTLAELYGVGKGDRNANQRATFAYMYGASTETGRIQTQVENQAATPRILEEPKAVIVGAPAQSMADKIRALLKQGKSRNEIAKELGTTYRYVYCIEHKG